MKKLSVFGKSVPIIALVMISILVVGASATLLTYYGGVTSTVTVSQAILLDGFSDPDSQVAETITGVGGDRVVGDEHYLTSQASDKIVVELVTLAGYDEAITDVYPMYKLDSIEGDDAVSFVLNAPVTWSDFTDVSFDYYIEEDRWVALNAANELEAVPWTPPLTGPWIPQINLKLLNSTGHGVYYTSWHSYRHGHLGTIGENASITAIKDDFYFYELPSWATLGLWSDAIWTGMTEIQTTATKAAIADLTFSSFSQQAGDTSSDPNDPTLANEVGYYPAKSCQIVFVGNYTLDVKGIIINPAGYDTGYDAVRNTVEFWMVYEIDITAEEDTYAVTTNVKPIGRP